MAQTKKYIDLVDEENVEKNRQFGRQFSVIVTPKSYFFLK